MSIERIGNGYIKIAVNQEDLEESLSALSQLKPILQAQVIKSNGPNKRQAAIDVRQLGKHFDTAINAMTMLLSEFEEYKDQEEQGMLIEMPCKFGDTVYVKMQSGEYAEAEVRDFAYFHTCGFCIVVTSDKFDKKNIPFSEFGKSVFLTLPEITKGRKE